MREDTTIPFRNPAYRDELSELVREGAQRIIHQAVEAELGAFLEEHAADHDAQGRRAVVRNGYLPSREVLTGARTVETSRKRGGEARQITQSIGRRADYGGPGEPGMAPNGSGNLPVALCDVRRTGHHLRHGERRTRGGNQNNKQEYL